MNERYKIGEAKYFLEKMKSSIEDRQALRFNLSAFLAAARSVLQYAREESREKGRQRWYDETVSRNDVLSYFKGKRDINIHGEPVNPSMDFSIQPAGGAIVFSGGSTVVFIRGDKTVSTDQPKGELSLPVKEEPPVPVPTPPANRSRTTIRYRFDDWPGPEDLISLSHRYIEGLEKFVQSGVDEGILSG